MIKLNIIYFYRNFNFDCVYKKIKIIENYFKYQ